MPAPEPLSARRAGPAAHALSRPSSFDATVPAAPRKAAPAGRDGTDAANGDRFRLDVDTRAAHRRSESRHPRGVISCQIARPARRAARQGLLPGGQAPGSGCLTSFDPEVQRLFRRRPRALIAAAGQAASTVERGREPGGRPAASAPPECFAVKGKEIDGGTYCYLLATRPAASGCLATGGRSPAGNSRSARSSRSARESVFRPPVRPTPLPS